MAPKRVSKVAKKAPVQTYPNGEPKVKWIHFAPAHSKTRPWRIQITGMVRFFNFYFVLLKLYFLFPFVRRRNIPSPPWSLRSFVLTSSKRSPSKKLPLRIFSFPLLSGQVHIPNLEALVEDIAVVPPGLACFYILRRIQPIEHPSQAW